MRDREEEIGELAEQLRSYAGRTDEDAIIGKLQVRRLGAWCWGGVALHTHPTNRPTPPHPPPGGCVDAQEQLPRLPAQA
jgi:hypothetical protein